MIIALVVIISLATILGTVWWLKMQFPTMARETLKQMGEDFLKLAQGTLDLERQSGLNDLDAKRRDIETAIKGLNAQLEKCQKLVNDFESDRDKKYGRLEGELQRITTSNNQLQQTTANLAAVLGNARIRGQWGQKMADDILRACGLQEGIQYQREKELIVGRPDYKFLLPDGYHLFMDVKFPFDNYLKFTGAREEEQRVYREAFIKDVRTHLREMERRDYLAQSDHTVDYIVIFIPNEQVYGFINEWEPGLIDECLRKKIILCGPWTLYAVIRIICQAWEHYRYSEAVRDIVKAIDGFRRDYEIFKSRFEDLGKWINKSVEKYQEISSTSYQRLDQRIKRIEKLRKGEGAVEELATEEGVQFEPMTQLKVEEK